MSIYTNSSTNIAHGIETRDLLFTLSNGMNIHSVDDGYGRLKFWFSTSNDLEKPQFDIRHYMEDAQEWYYTNYVRFDPKNYENIWHDRVKECLERVFVPLISSIDPGNGFIICYSMVLEKTSTGAMGGLPLDYWYLVETWKFVCEYCKLDSSNVCVLPTGQLWVSAIAMDAAQKISLTAIKRNRDIVKIRSKRLG